MAAGRRRGVRRRVGDALAYHRLSGKKHFEAAPPEFITATTAVPLISPRGRDRTIIPKNSAQTGYCRQPDPPWSANYLSASSGSVRQSRAEPEQAKEAGAQEHHARQLGDGADDNDAGTAGEPTLPNAPWPAPPATSMVAPLLSANPPGPYRIVTSPPPPPPPLAMAELPGPGKMPPAPPSPPAADNPPVSSTELASSKMPPPLPPPPPNPDERPET